MLQWPSLSTGGEIDETICNKMKAIWPNAAQWTSLSKIERDNFCAASIKCYKLYKPKIKNAYNALAAAIPTIKCKTFPVKNPLVIAKDNEKATTYVIINCLTEVLDWIKKDHETWDDEIAKNALDLCRCLDAYIEWRVMNLLKCDNDEGHASFASRLSDLKDKMEGCSRLSKMVRERMDLKTMLEQRRIPGQVVMMATPSRARTNPFFELATPSTAGRSSVDEEEKPSENFATPEKLPQFV